VDGTLLCEFVGPEIIFVGVGPSEGDSVTALDGATNNNSDGT
jgi:hypothetical protein